MSIVYVAQTHEKDRDAATAFLKAAGYDAKPYATDPMSLTWLTREMMFAKEAFSVVASQRDLVGCDYLSNLIHTVAMNAPKPTLTVVYTRSAAHQESVQGMVRYFTALISNDRHQVKIVPKVADSTRDAELGTVLGHIQNFFASLRQLA